MKCIIPAAGFGTRLKDIASNIPKALLKVKSKAILDYLVENLIQIPDLTEVTIVSNAKFYNQFSTWKSQSAYSIPINLINNGITQSEKILGSIRDIRLGINLNHEEDYIIVLSDNLFNFSLKDVHKYFKEKNKDVIVVVDVKSLEEIKKFGCVEINKNRIITNFIEKPDKPKSTLAATGIYIFKNSTMKLVDTYLKQGNSPHGPGYFVQWLYPKKPVSCYVVEQGQWCDIGSIETYKKLN